jgi:UDP-N-acetylmuramate dehydrogenase
LMATTSVPLSVIAHFGDRLRRGERLDRYTSARLGGPADYLVVAKNLEELRAAARLAWDAGLPLLVLGAGSNVLVDDRGFRGLVVINRAQNVHFEVHERSVTVQAESGASLSSLARQCVERGLSGLEWAVNVPGTVGGAVVNNAGAHGGDMATLVRAVTVLYAGGQEQTWPVEAMEYAYRESRLKGDRAHVVLAASLSLGREAPAVLRERASAFTAKRKASQPPGASLGSIFKNPTEDYAGRLIEAAGLKGARVGDVMISPMHANFFVNAGQGRAADYRALIALARETVRTQFGVELELEVEMIRESFSGEC